jgi:hypothetical protein
VKDGDGWRWMEMDGERKAERLGTDKGWRG